MSKKIPTETISSKPADLRENSDEPSAAQVALAEKIRDVLMYIGSNTNELKSDLNRVHAKCKLFKQHKLCRQCVLFLDNRCVFWDKHFKQFEATVELNKNQEGQNGRETGDTETEHQPPE